VALYTTRYTTAALPRCMGSWGDEEVSDGGCVCVTPSTGEVTLDNSFLDHVERRRVVGATPWRKRRASLLDITGSVGVETS
jgi:hypothetical protein